MKLIYLFFFLIITSCKSNVEVASNIADDLKFQLPNHIVIVDMTKNNEEFIDKAVDGLIIDPVAETQAISLLIKVDILDKDFAIARQLALEESIFTALKLINSEYFANNKLKPKDEYIGKKESTNYRPIKNRSIAELMQLVVVKSQSCFPMRLVGGEVLECEVDLLVPIIE